jgi:hypothetical protein
MILLVGFYQDVNPIRTQEFVECVRRNAANPFVDRIVVFLEEALTAFDACASFPILAHRKVCLVGHGRRLTYCDLFEYANRHFAGRLIALANADIYFDATLAALDDRPLAGRMFCLSRWDETSPGVQRHFDRSDSQDAWLFESPLPRIEGSFHLGAPGCDNRIAYEAERAGLLVSNPSRTIRACHLHTSEIRRYTPQDRVEGPTRMVPASFLTEAPEVGTTDISLLDGFPSHRSYRARRTLGERCTEVEGAVAPFFDGLVPPPLSQAIRRAVAARLSMERPVDLPLAAVGFRESMGYTVARLKLGVSTHNNDPRPLTAVPPSLANLRFTQVVANHAAPVEIEFRSSGRIFVLAATGWEGYAPVAAFLDAAGWREPMDSLHTRDGTSFEVWSLVASQDERVVVPTQAMLVAEDLVRLD